MPFADPEFRTDIERMLAYHSWSRAKYLDLFERLPWTVLTRKRGSTFESIRNVHLHVLAVYAYWLYRHFGRRSMGPLLAALHEKQFAKVRSVSQLREMNRKVDICAQQVARELGPADFDRKTPVKGPHGQRWFITPREVFWHMIEEDFLHHGEILCMLWQDDIEPPYTGVWWFEYDHDPKRHRDLWFTDPTIPRPSLGGYVADPKRRPRTPTRASSRKARNRRES